MQSRLRRRVSVVASYALFLVAIWAPSSRIAVAMLFLWVIWLWCTLSPQLVDAVPRWATRTIACAAWLGGIWLVWKTPQRTGSGISDAVYAVALLTQASPLGWGKLVDSARRGWMAQAIQRPESLSAMTQRRLAISGYAVGLEGIARYEHGLRFRELTPEQKAEVEVLHRQYSRGRWMPGRQRVLFDDERLRHEDDRVRAQVQRTLSWLLLPGAVALSILLADGQPVPSQILVASAWTLAALATTLRQAIVLWTEEDPRGVTGELNLIPDEAA